jgi:hypothetical protein
MPDKPSQADRDRPDGAGATKASDLVLSPEERQAVLARAVADKTREARASLASKGEFEAVLRRGRPVNHVLHFAVLVGLVAALSGAARLVTSETGALLAAAAAGTAYGLFWLGLALTGGVERERLSVDEQGHLTSTFSGRRVETRANVLKVAIPGAIVVLGAYLAVGLIHDVVIPPPPHCSVAWKSETDPCLMLPDVGALPSAEGLPGSQSQPQSEKPHFSVAATRVLEQVVRIGLLIIVLAVTLAAAWFLRRMLNGRGFLWLEPVRGSKE